MRQQKENPLCEYDTAPDSPMVVLVERDGRLLSARKFCVACIRSGRAYQELGLIADRSIEPAPESRSGVRSLREIERDAIFDAIDATGGNTTAAARLLGISRSTLYRRLAQRSGFYKAVA